MIRNLNFEEQKDGLNINLFPKTKNAGASIAQRGEGGAHEDVEEKELSRWNGDCNH